jgi:hypothetical protein
MIIRTGHGQAIEDYEPAHVPGHVIHVRGDTAMFRRRSVQPTRRALLHVQAPGDPAVAPDLVRWYTERAFHFYLAGLRLLGPAPLPLLAGKPTRRLGPAFADLDAACAQLRAADSIDTVIVMASGRSAAAAALWRAARPQAADALILHAPEFAGRPRVRRAGAGLDIDCPVLVVTWQGNERPRRPEPAAIQLGAHVTWRRLASGSALGSRSDAVGVTGVPGGQAYFDELGRWLGAYMYGLGRDQLL